MHVAATDGLKAAGAEGLEHQRGLLVELAGDQFIIPMSAVTENVELSRAGRSRRDDGWR